MLRRLAVVLAVLVAAWLVFCVVFFVRPPAETGPPKHADAIVVLAGQQSRLPEALRLARDAVAPTLALSSVNRMRPWRQAQRLCAAGRYAGVRVLCFEADPYSTRGEARVVARLARARRWHSIVIVSSTYHLTRAKLLFRRCWDGRIFLVGTSDPRWLLPYDWATETAKLLVQETIERSC